MNGVRAPVRRAGSGRASARRRGTGKQRRPTAYQATDIVRENFASWANVVEGRETCRCKPEQLVENIRVFAAMVVSSRNNGADRAL